LSWLSDRIGIHLGNVGGPIGAAIGSFIPGIGTTAGAALGQGLGAWGHGDGVKSALLQGGLTYGGGKALEGLQHAFTGGGAASGGVQQAGAPMGSAGGFEDPSDLLHPDAFAHASSPSGAFAPSSAASGGGQGFLGKVGTGLSNAWEKNPGSVLQGAGSVAGAFGNMGANNANTRYGNAQADALEMDNEQKKRRDAAMEPFRRALAGQFSQLGQYHIAPNPYGTGANPYGR
jgi:hypothetical protein